ncbi:hypothetical protein Cch01nite_09160 [Cellulomonas chitinilytica]|uniref:HTH luxR-type domain-containing protein n=2 Tax=Cellulomonas chitinilytica TaxID=398759 RepID=A0A919P130_9CELL|nr:hypothetical protein Cch01nite_09160 [Cellulomonas chitinilytica]
MEVSRAPTSADLRRLLVWAGELLELSEDGAITTTLLRGAAEVVGSDTATVTHVDVRTRQEVAVLWPQARAVISKVGAYAELGHTHPLRPPALTATAERGRVLPVRISDVLTRPAWRRSALHVDAMPDIADQITLPLFRRDGVLHALTLGRHSGTFTDRQRDLLAEAGAHVRAALARVHAARTGLGGVGLQLAPHPRWVPLGVAPGVPADPGGGTGRSRAPGRPAAALSAREREVLELVAEGLTDAQVARRLGLRPATVSRHLHRLYGRNGVTNRAAAVLLLGASSGTRGRDVR